MYEISDVIQDLKAMAKRRRAILIFTPVLFGMAAAIAFYFIEPKYKSFTTILVQKDESHSPITFYESARNTGTPNRLESLNEIIYSRSTMDILIDSLRLDADIESETGRQRLIAKTRNNIATNSRSTDSFEISYTDTDPVRARDGVQLLTDHFMNTRLMLETRRHDETVAFLSNKVDELERMVNEQRGRAATTSTERLRELPVDTEALQSRLRNIDEQLDAIEWQLVQEEEKLALIKAFQSEPNTNDGMRHLYRLPLSDIQFGGELSELLKEYDELQQQFTDSYPRLRSIATQIRQVADRIPPTIESNLLRINSQKSSLAAQKERVVSDMQRSYVATQQASSQQSDFSIYEEMYNDMKMKLEQAKMTREIGREASAQFIILDAANVPEKPASPNKKLILGIGLLLGLIIGAVASVLAEVMDTTMRNEKDLLYKKPIIAYIVNG